MFDCSITKSDDTDLIYVVLSAEWMHAKGYASQRPLVLSDP